MSRRTYPEKPPLIVHYLAAKESTTTLCGLETKPKDGPFWVIQGLRASKQHANCTICIEAANKAP